MGLFDFLKRRQPPSPRTPSPEPSAAAADLMETLTSAAERGDAERLARLCAANRPQILAEFPAWQTVPPAVRADPAAQERYCRGLIAVAAAFEEAGDPSLIARLTGEPADNPLLAWERDLSEAQALVDGGEPTRAAELLSAVLERIAGLTGPGVDHFLPRTYGLLGVAHYRAGDAGRAAEFTRKAEALCAAAGDAEGVAVYVGNLRQMGIGPTDSAAPAGDDVVFTDAAGRRLTRGELLEASGTIQWEVVGGAPVPEAARALHADARAAGAAGDYDRALSLLDEAQRLAPDWPYPAYDAAFTHLLRDEAAEAEEMYRRVDALAPRGFFTAKTALDSLARERAGQIPAGSYLKLVSAEWVNDPDEKRRIVEALLAASGDFPAAWKELAVLAEDDGAKLAAIDRGLACRPDAETAGVLLINRALILERQGDRAAAMEILGKLATDPASTSATEQLAKATLAGLIGRE